MSIEVRVGTLPGIQKTVTLEDGATVQDAIDTAEMNAAGYDIRVDGDEATLGDVIEDGDMILLVKAVKGNAAN